MSEVRDWQWLVGRWSIEASHRLLPDAFGGTTTFDWLEDQQLLVQTSHFDHPEIPDAFTVTAVLDGRPTMHYFDVRGVHRVFFVEITGDTWRYWNDTPGFAQRFTGTRHDDGRTINGEVELSVDNVLWAVDLTMTCRRIE